MSRKLNNKEEKQGTQDGNKNFLNSKVDLKFKPIQEQIKEDTEKSKISFEEQKQEIMAELGIDEKLLSLLRT